MDDREDRLAEPGSFNAQLTGQFRGLFRTLVARCSRILHDRDMAEDVAQEAIVRAWRHRGRFEAGRSLGAWINTIGVRACLDAQRQRSRRSHQALGESAGDSPSSDPSEAITETEERNAVWNALIRLCPRHRFVLVRRYLDGESYDTVAAEMGTTVETTYALSLRARKAFESNYEHAVRERAAEH